MALAPGMWVAIAFALLGIGFVVAAFLSEGFATARLLLGLAAIVLALLVAGAQSLLGHAGSMKEEA